MKYTTKSGKELPPEVVEVIEQLKKEYGENNCTAFGLNWFPIPTTIDKAITAIYMEDNFTEFYKLYPKKDLDSYGNEIVKGEMVEVKHRENGDWVEREFFGIADKSKTGIYGVYDSEYKDLITFTFCRKINPNESKKSELQTQMNDLLKQAKEIEAKINEL